MLKEWSDKVTPEQLIPQEDYDLLKANLASQRDVKHYFSTDQRRVCSVIPAEPDGDCGFTGTRRVLELIGEEDIANKISRKKFIELVKINLAQGDETIQAIIEEIFKDAHIPDGDSEQRLRKWSAVFKSKGYWMSTPHFALLSKVYNIEFRFYCLNEENMFIPELGNEVQYCGDNPENKVVVNLAYISMTPRDGNESLNHFDGLILDPTEEQQIRIRLMRGESQPKEKSSSVMKLAGEERQRELEVLAKQSQNFSTRGEIENARKIYVELLKLAHEIDQYHYESQVLGYEGLGKVYELNEKWIDAIAIYHFALGVMDNPEKTKAFTNVVEVYQKRLIESIERCEKTFLTKVTGRNIASMDYTHYQSRQLLLESIAVNAIKKAFQNDSVRKKFEAELGFIEERISLLQRLQDTLEKNRVSVEQMHRQISMQLREFIKVLIEECIEQLKEWKAPLSVEDYAVICFGSLARDEATPYSDLEFGVLLAEGKDTEENREYFRVLTKLLNIKVINMHATLPRMQYIQELVDLGIAGVYSKGPVKAGFSFDGNKAGARKTPLGNREYLDVPDEKKYELIQTPQKLAEYHNQEWFNKDNQLSSVLMTASLIKGNKGLLTQYEGAVDAILDQVTVVEKAGAHDAEQVTMTLRQRRALGYLHESVEKFQFRGGRFEKEGHYFDAKYHLYRLPNMWIDHLSMYFNGKEKSSWGRLRELFGEDKLIGQNKEGLVNLIDAVSVVSLIRLYVYLHAQERDNYVLNLEDPCSLNNSQRISQHLGVSEEYFIQVYRTFVPLQLMIQEFLINNDRTKFLNFSYYDPSSFVLGWYYQMLVQYTKALEAYKKDIQRAGNEGPVYISTITTWINIGNIFLEQGQYKNALEAYEKAKDIAESVFSLGDIFLADIWNNIGVVCVKIGNYKRALDAFEKEESIIAQLYGADHILMARLLNNRAGMHKDLSWYENALSELKKAKLIIENVYGSNHISMADVWIEFGNVYLDQGEHEKALNAYEKAKTIRSDMHGQEHVLVADIWINIGNVYKASGYYAKALSAYELAKSIYFKVYGPVHISIANVHNNIGIIYEENGLYEKALREYEQDIAITTRLLGSNHISVASTWNNIGNVYSDQGKYTEALEAFENMRSITLSVHNSNHISLGEMWINIGVVYSNQGRYEEALQAYQKAESVIKDVYGTAHISFADNLQNIGNVYSQRGEYEKAIAAYQESIKITKEVLGLRHNSVATTLKNMGDTYVDMQDFKNARKVYKEALKIFEENQYPNYDDIYQQLQRSYVREGNLLYLQDQMAEAKKCYQQSGYDFDFLSVDSHEFLASEYVKYNQLPGAIEHLRVVVKLAPMRPGAHQNLACMYHCRAQLEKMIGNDDGYSKDLKEAKISFDRVIGNNRNASVLTEYAHFMMKNRELFSLTEIMSYLNEAIELNQPKHGLSYGVLERYTVDKLLQKLIDQHKDITCRAFILASFLLIKCYLMNNQPNAAMKLLAALETEIAGCLDGNFHSIKQLEGIRNEISPDHFERLTKRYELDSIVCKALLQQAQYLVNTPVEKWEKEEEQNNEQEESSQTTAVLRSPGKDGLFGKKSNNPQPISRKIDQHMISEIKDIVGRGRIFEDKDTNRGIVFASYDDAVNCQALLYKIGIPQNDSPDEVREIDVIEDNDLGQSEYVFRITQEEYENIFGRSLIKNLLG